MWHKLFYLYLRIRQSKKILCKYYIISISSCCHSKFRKIKSKSNSITGIRLTWRIWLLVLQGLRKPGVDKRFSYVIFYFQAMCKRLSPSLNIFFRIYEFKQLNHILHPTINFRPKPPV